MLLYAFSALNAKIISVAVAVIFSLFLIEPSMFFFNQNYAFTYKDFSLSYHWTYWGIADVKIKTVAIQFTLGFFS